MTIANSGGYEQSSPYLQIDAPTRGIGDLIQMFKNDVKKFWVDSTGDTHIVGDLYPEKIVNRVSVVANAASLTPE